MTQDERSRLTPTRFASLDDSNLIQFELPTARAASGHQLERLVRDHPAITLLAAVAFGFMLGKTIR
jgi:hypothetical protein